MFLLKMFDNIMNSRARLKKSLKNGLGYGDALGREVVEKIKNKLEAEPETET